ncbi:hypothetical protein SAMN02949497_2885 [Methylomagnum ishizawai]|uniref:Uncharacterized protein n=1 Tax=Methylomagnum ishizawai TaxID=1760988 RepID=A0A1Y6CZ69_9GAMM|nr:hypothetical protein SAMN02949497_2885 [Methylomagnum ishizawai]
MDTQSYKSGLDGAVGRVSAADTIKLSSNPLYKMWNMPQDQRNSALVFEGIKSLPTGKLLCWAGIAAAA